MALKSFMQTRTERDEPETTQSTPAPAPSAPAPRTVAPSTSIDATSEFNGKLSSKETIRIDGRVIGELTCDKTVLIGEGADVRASITADTVEVGGRVKGDITARAKLTLKRTARVTGDLKTPGIVVEEGAQLEGRIMIGSDDAQKAAEAKSKSESKAESKPAAQRPAPKEQTPMAASPA